MRPNNCLLIARVRLCILLCLLINLVCDTLHLLTKSNDLKMGIYVGEILISIAFKLVGHPSTIFVITSLTFPDSYPPATPAH